MFLGACQDLTPSPIQSLCNYLHSVIEHLEERDFLTFRNETVKLLSEIQYKVEERKRQVTTSQQVTTFQLPEVTQATAGREYILTIPDTQPVFVPVVQPSQIATTQPATVIAKVHNHQGQHLIFFTLSPEKTVNPPSVASGQQEGSQHDTSGLSSLFEGIPSVLQ